MRKRAAFAIVLGAWFTLLSPRIVGATSRADIPLCRATGDQQNPVIVTDGAGGAIVVWHDRRNGDDDIYAQHIGVTGLAQWAVDGVALCSAAGDQTTPSMIADDAGGAIVMWSDSRNGNIALYAQRIAADGSVQWEADGVALCTAVSDQYNASGVLNLSGGMNVTWQDDRSGSQDIYAQQISADGIVQWTPGGVVVCGAGQSQGDPVIALAGWAGAFIIWSDFRNGSNFDIYIQRLDYLGVAQWAYDGMALCTEGSWQTHPAITLDGVDGLIVTWQETRHGSQDLYAQSVNGGGSIRWAPDGVPVCTAGNDQTNARIVRDGTGGAIVVWEDGSSGATDIHAQRLLAGGTVQWASNGVALCAAAGAQSAPAIIADSEGWTIVTWQDERSFPSDLFAQAISIDGTMWWGANGAAICTSFGEQTQPKLVTDGEGGAIVTWQDGRSGADDIYAQLVTRFGTLGSEEPVIVSVRDIPNDQGGRMKLSWYSSFVDDGPAYGIGAYWIWRSVPPNVAELALSRGARLVESDKISREPDGQTLTMSIESGQTIFWEYVGSQYASADAGYSYVVPTTSDSLAGSNPYTLVRVQARASSGTAFWNSAPDSGYSVDNLAPAAPAPFTGRYLGSATALHWGPSVAPDFSGYRLYRGDAAGFVPGPATFVAAQSDTGYVDAVPDAHYYKLCAVDVHGNPSAYAVLTPGQTNGVPGLAPAMLRLYPNQPNPFNPSTTIKYDLPEAGSVRLSVYDVAGRLIRSLVDESMQQGSHKAVWDGRDASGREVGSGSYLARLEFGGKVETTTMGLIR